MGLPEPASEYSGYRDFRLRPGTILKDTYQILRVLGQGGAGVVYKARHTSLGNAVAVKVLNPTQSLSEDMRNRFLAEARIQANFQHPHSVMVLDAIDEDGLCGIVMELIDGETLWDYLAHHEGDLPIPTALDICVRVLDALASAHREGIVHRDVKPANILLKEVSGGVVPKLCDFGLAKVDYGARTTRPGTRMGTEAYMAPEQVLDAAKVDARADIYAIGRTLYEMVTGIGETSPLMRHDAGPLPPAHEHRPDTPRHISDAIQRAVARDPDDRFETAEAFAKALVGDTGSLRAIHDTELVKLGSLVDSNRANRTVTRGSETPRMRPSSSNAEVDRGLRVLLVDGDDVDRMTTRRYLERSGSRVTVREAGGVSSAFVALREETFDCALIDFDLPDGDGFDLLECLHETRAEGVAVVVLSSIESEEIGTRLIRRGAQDFLSKHRTNADSLLRALRHAIERHRTHSKLEAEQRRVEEARDTDFGTGLLSRRGLSRRMDAAWAAAGGSPKLIWLVVSVTAFDGRRGQPVAPSSQLAHEVGDLLRSATPQPDLVGRLDAAHFLCLVHGSFPVDAVTLARRVERALTGDDAPSYRGHPVRVRIVTGHATTPMSADEISAVAMQAIEAHGDRADALLVQATSDALSMSLFERSLRDKGEPPSIAFVEQSIVNLIGSTTWARELFLAPPTVVENRFVPFADAGALLHFDFECFHSALRTLPNVDAGLVFLNVHPWAVRDPRFAETLQVLIDQELQDRVVLEVSQLWIREPDALAEALERARSRGFRVSIDNIRPGFEAADLLVRLRPDYAKTAVSALAEAVEERSALERLRRFCRLARELKVEAIALGVDSPVTRSLVDSAGFQHAQGFLFGRPAPVASYQAVFRAS